MDRLLQEYWGTDNVRGSTGEGTGQMTQGYNYDALTGRIIGCAMTVHSGLGNGFQKIIYQSALAMEMADAGIPFSREHEMPVYYKGRQIGLRRVDFLVEGVICVELKAVIELTDAHLAQAKNYLEAYDLNVGLQTGLFLVQIRILVS